MALDGVTLEIVTRLPDVDSYGVPLTKMPNCPNCGSDELGMVQAARAVCNACGCIAVASRPSMYIQEVPAVCKFCPWQGMVQACEPSDSGDLMCPQCGNEIVIRINESDLAI